MYQMSLKQSKNNIGELSAIDNEIFCREEEYYKLILDDKTGKPQLSLVKVINEKSILWGATSWKPELERFMSYKRQTYIFGEEAEDNLPDEFEPFIKDPDKYIEENADILMLKDRWSIHILESL